MQSGLDKRNYSLDIARIIAALAVVMVHCSAYFVTRYPCFSDEFVLGNIFDSLSRIGVPLFLMISGALFLDEEREITLKGIFRKNVLGLAVITVIWAIIYSVVDSFVLKAPQPVSVREVVDKIVYGYYHMWYLYMIIGLYIITPFLRKFVRKDNTKMVLLFIVICFAVQFVVPMLDKLVQHFIGVDYVGALVNKLKLGFFGDYLTYFVAGWYIVHVKIKRKWLVNFAYVLGVASLFAIILYTHFTGDYLNAYNNISVPVFVCAISAFLALTSVKIKPGEKMARTLKTLSKLTFGVYIIHAMILEFIFKWFPYKSAPLLYLAACYVGTLAVSFALAFVLSKIPVIKRLMHV